MGFRDMDLNDDVRARLRRDGTLSGFRIDVNVRNGIVYLKGNVSAHARKHALEVAQGVNAVAAVIDQMTVG
jgi:osmotically-inducible protein OsmY